MLPIKRTIKKHPLLSTIIIDSNQFSSILILYFIIIAAYFDNFSMLHFFFNNVRTHTYAQARISLLFL